MKILRSVLAAIVGLSLACPMAALFAAAPANPFYAMDTAFAPHFRKSALSQAQGLALVKELGYDGVAWMEKSPEVVKADLADIEKHGLRMYAIYSHAEVTPQADIAISTGAVPTMHLLKGHCDILWIHIGGKGPAVASLGGNEPLVVKLRAGRDGQG